MTGRKHIGFQIVAVCEHSSFRTLFRVAGKEKRRISIDYLYGKAGFIGVVRVHLFRRKNAELRTVCKDKPVVPARADKRLFPN